MLYGAVLPLLTVSTQTTNDASSETLRLVSVDSRSARWAAVVELLVPDATPISEYVVYTSQPQQVILHLETSPDGITWTSATAMITNYERAIRRIFPVSFLTGYLRCRAEVFASSGKPLYTCSVQLVSNYSFAYTKSSSKGRLYRVNG